jgi:SAM-dependent methyltransferase
MIKGVTLENSSPYDLNSPERYYEIRSLLTKKNTLRSFYKEVYQKYSNCIQRTPSNGISLEIGSGGGFAKDMLPHIITSDIISYPNVDRIMDATQLDFANGSLSCICMFNVLHHIPNTPQFFKEAIRCLKPGGRIFMVEPYAGWFSSWIYKYIHHEDFDKKVAQWEFISNGPLTDANNALPWVIFERDKARFMQEFPDLSIVQFNPHTPLRYWLTGGLKNWSLLPTWLFKFSTWLDKALIKISPRLGSFVDIELVKL